jgi:AcrR family transcriptional regulator
MAQRHQRAGADPGPRALWFNPPGGDEDEDRRRALTRERVVAEALTVIGADGVDALSMRALATRLGVVPGALYRHVRNKEQLHDLVLDGALAEVDCQLDHALPWTEQVKALAHRLRSVLEDHPGVAGLLKTRDPLGPHSLALAEAFLTPLRGRQARTGDRPGVLPDLRLHPRFRARQPLRQRATRPVDIRAADSADRNTETCSKQD